MKTTTRLFASALAAGVLGLAATATAQQPGPFPGSAGASVSSQGTDPELRRALEETWKRDAKTRESLEALAEQFAAQKKWGDAAQVYARVADLWGPDADAQFKAARMMAYSGEYDRSITWLNKVLVTAPDSMDAKLMLARVHAWNGRFSEADRVLADVRAKKPTNAEPYVVMGDVLYWQGRYPEAERQFATALQLSPLDQAAMRSAARNYLAMGEVDKAEAMAPGLTDAGDLETLRRIADARRGDENPFRIDAAYTWYMNLDREDWHGVHAAFSYAISPAATIGLSADVMIREDLPGTVTDVMLGVFGTFRPTDWLRIETSLGFTPDPAFSHSFRFDLKPVFSLASWLDLYAAYTLRNYSDAGLTPGEDLWINQIGPGVVFHFGPVDLDLSYRAVLYDADVDLGHLGSGRVDVRVIPEVVLFAGASYGEGVEVFYTERAGRIQPIIQDSLTVLGGLGWDIHPQHGVNLTWSYWTTDPNRDNQPVVGIFQHSLTAHYYARF